VPALLPEHPSPRQSPEFEIGRTLIVALVCTENLISSHPVKESANLAQ
jgi:hypothetical protein